MQGVILDFSIQNNTGIISGNDQNRYNFVGAAWRGTQVPKRGDKVDFAIGENNEALDVYIVVGHSNNPLQHLSEKLDHISNQNQSEDHFNMLDWFIKSLKNYVNFSGRARRKEFWFFSLSQFLILLLAMFIDAVLFDTTPVLYFICALGLFIPALAVSVRRLHDLGKSGWWYLIAFIPLIGVIMLLIWFISETKPETNQWGKPAK